MLNAVDEGALGEVAGSIHSLSVVVWPPRRRIDIDVMVVKGDWASLSTSMLNEYMNKAFSVQVKIQILSFTNTSQQILNFKKLLLNGFRTELSKTFFEGNFIKCGYLDCVCDVTVKHSDSTDLTVVGNTHCTYAVVGRSRHLKINKSNIKKHGISRDDDNFLILLPLVYRYGLTRFAINISITNYRCWIRCVPT